jgi:chromate transporter
MSAAPLAQPGSLRELFTTFNGLALQGFGGVLAVAQRALCEERGWLTQAQFVELLAVSRVLPGPNVCNLAVLVGDRCFGWRGAAAALAGMIALPLVIVLALAAMYSQFSQVPAVAGALKGMGAVAAGLIAGTALKLAATLRDSVLGRRACLALGVVTFMLVAILRLPLAWMILGVGAIGGAITVVPDVHRLPVGQMNLVDDTQFNASIVIGQAAPGPNVLFVAVLGYQAAGLVGALTTPVAMMLPSATLALAVGRWGHARRELIGVRAFKAGMAPIVIGPTAATTWLLVAQAPGKAHWLVTAGAALTVWRTRIHLIWLIGAGAVIGALGVL